MRQTYFEGSITVQRSNLDGSLPGNGSIVVLGHKVPDEALVSLLSGLGVRLLIEKSASKTSQPAVGEHGGGGALDVVTLNTLVLLVHDEFPEVRLGALGAEESGGEILVVSDEALVAGVRFGEDVEDFDERPDVPADGAGPNDRGGAGLGVSPDGGLALVEAVDGKTGFLVDGDFLDLIPLKDNIIPGRGVLGIELSSPLSVEAIAHEDAIQPHLIRVRRRAMPEPTSRRPRMLVDSITDEIRSDLVLLLAGLLVPVQQVQADAVVVKRVLCQVIVDDGAVGVHHIIHLVAVPCEQGLVLGQLDGGFDALVDDRAAVPVCALGLSVVADP